MSKIVIIGAGSGFGSRLSIDIMSREVLRDSTICLCDLHEGRLKKVGDYVRATIEKYHLPTKLVCDTDRRKLLPGADFVITSVAVGGGAYYGHPFKEEIDIAAKYGIDQAVADSYSVGATFRLLRTAPVQLAIVRDMEKYCPQAMLLNHTNPMSGLTAIHSLGSGIRNVGICHGVQGTAGTIAEMLQMKREDVRYRVAGINHLAWFLKLEDSQGNDLYPKLRALLDDAPPCEEVAKVLGEEKVRMDVFRHFGYFPTESTRHDSEYMPYFRRTPELRARYGLESRVVPDRLTAAREWLKDGMDGEGQITGELKLSHEYTSGIMEAVLTDIPFRFNGNVMNTGLITNLPQRLCVEVPCIADRHGVQATHVGDLPTHLAGLDRAIATPTQLAVEAVLEKDREKAFYAVALDPNVAATLPLSDIRKLFEEMWAMEGDLLEWFWTDNITERYALN